MDSSPLIMASLQRPIDDLPCLYQRLVQRYGTNEQCRKSLRRVVWPQGFVCRRCRHRTCSYIQTRDLYECVRCKTQHSVTAGLPVHGMRHNLAHWFAIAFFFITGDTPYELRREAQRMNLPERTLRRWLRKLNGHWDRDLDRFLRAFMHDLRTS